MLFDNYDRIRIVNLPHRRDRRSAMRRQLAKVGLLEDPRVAFFPAVAPGEVGLFSSRGAHGCFLSHSTILKEAADAEESVLILEDDCDFLPQAMQYELHETCDVFYGGYVARDPSNPHDSDIIGAHFMGFSAEAAVVAARYLSGFLHPDFKGDPRAVSEPGYNPNVRPGIDGAYVWLRRAHPGLVTVFEQLSIQRSSRTDIGDQRLFDRVPVVRDLAQWGRRLARHLPDSLRPRRHGNMFD